MTKNGIILIEPESPRLNYLKTIKPLILVYGQPLILHSVDDFKQAGISDIMILAPEEIIEQIKKTIDDDIEPKTNIKFIAYSQGTFNKTLSQLLVESKADHYFISFCGLIFENNPYTLFRRKKELEILIDKNLLHNKFSGTAHKVKISLLGLQKLGTDIGDYNAQLIRAYYVAKNGTKELARVLQNNPSMSFEEAMMECGREKKLGISVFSKHLWYEINSPETSIRAEMLLRKKYQGARPTKVRIDKLEPIADGLSFSYKKTQTTQVVIERGLLDKLDRLEIMEPDRTASHHIIITDPIVDKMFGEKVFQKFKNGGYLVTKLVAPSGETAKTMDIYREFAEKIVGLGIDEHSVIFSLGGGAIANLAGFLAATLYRGIGLIHIPTTLMCMNDVAISLKQAINDQRGKNLVGSYYQPLLVLIDPSIEMNETIVSQGLSETIKHALAQDVNFFDALISYKGRITDMDFLEMTIRRTIELKIELMTEDMFENYQGIVLQYGHEVGHALEHLSHFKLSHGEAISIGMRVSAEISYLMGVTGVETVVAHKKIFKHYNLPFSVPSYITKDAIVDALKFNKKTRGSDIRFALVEFVGKIWKIKQEYGIPVSINIIDEALRKSYQE